MKDKPLSKHVGKLCNKLQEGGLHTIARLIHDGVGDRSIADHDRWDNETRTTPQNMAVDALADSIHTPPRECVEISPSDLRSIENLPPIDLGTFADARENTELRALEATKSIIRDGRRVLISNPSRLLSSLATFLCEETIWRAYGVQLKIAELYDEVVSPVQRRLQYIANRDNLLKLSCHASRLYGVKVDLVEVARIYQGAPEFVARAGAGTALTMATSSGIIDPLERFGTEEVLQKLAIERGSEIAKRIAPKSPWRVVNFRDGLLNPKMDARRLYFFDRQNTGATMRKTLAALSSDKQEIYKVLAAELLTESLECRRFELFEVESFAPWMWRYTRSAPGHVLISFRNPDTRAIREGMELNFKDPKSRHRWFQRVFRWTGVIPPLQLVVAVAGEAEDLLFEHVDGQVIRRNAELDVLANSRKIKLEGKTIQYKLEKSRQIIDQLCASGTA